VAKESRREKAETWAGMTLAVLLAVIAGVTALVIVLTALLGFVTSQYYGN
jgi:hypothetical protein